MSQTIPPLRLGIVGAGTIGTVHGLASRETDETSVIAVASRSVGHARDLADRLGARVHDSPEALMLDPEIDAVVVASPTFTHETYALLAAANGKHVICEKPLARNLASAEKMVAAAERAGVKLLAAHVVRFFPEFASLRQAVLDGQVGNPGVVRMSRAAAFPRGTGEWRNRPDLSGGVILDMALHDLDWLLWTFGPAKRVYAKGLYNRGYSFLDYALITVRLASGTIAHVEGSWAETQGFRTHGEVAGDAGLLTYDSDETEVLSVALHQPPSTPPGVAVPTSYTATSPYVLQLERSARCIRGTADPMTTPKEALDTLRLSLAALESVETGQPITL